MDTNIAYIGTIGPALALDPAGSYQQCIPIFVTIQCMHVVNENFK